MGTLRSLTDWSHRLTVNGVQLGDAVELDDDPTTFEWDDAMIPNGEITADGEVIPDESSIEPTPEPEPEPDE